MTAVMWVFNAVRKRPREVWGLLLLAFIVVGCYAAQQNALRAAYARGKRAAAQGVVFDSVTLARAAERVAKANAHTDTVTQRVLVTRYKVDTLIQALPDSAYRLPVVPELVATVKTLTVQVDSLTTAHASERLAHIERARVDSAAIYALRIIGTAQRDTIVQLQKRPTRLRAFTYALAAGALGVVVGVVK